MQSAQLIEKVRLIGEQANATVRWAELLKENSRLEHEKNVAILALIFLTQGMGQPGTKPIEGEKGAVESPPPQID